MPRGHRRRHTDADSWGFVEVFRRPGPAQPSWQRALELVKAGNELARRALVRLPPLVERWNVLLEDLDGEPTRFDWSEFRPLRLSREEDWSDWLGHLLARSNSGRFAGVLFGRDAAACVAPRVQRELAIENRRLDLRITWTDGTYAHVEVKTGDTALAKTFETARLHRGTVRGARCDDFLLLPRGDLALWEDARRAAGDHGEEIRAITWHDVARALRRALAVRAEESTVWRAWASSFLGAIHQTMLGHPRVTMLDEMRVGVEVGDFIELLEESLNG